jgi:aspartyl-tRNA(Asn)/glutamyl-tRNA(Gln) amidotransferase subunit B
MTSPAPARPPAGSALERYEVVVGIEVHCQLRTASKMFCGCSVAYDGAAPNTHTCPVCLGLPGALPTINRAAVEHVLATGLAVGAAVPPATRWDRKNYFYPDLPKGYQISQFELPLASGGTLAFDTSDGPITVRIRRAHLEEDTAKLTHTTGPTGERVSLVDFNRSGAPLMEIVTEPDVRSAEAARRYAEELQLLLRAIGVSDADMERGQMRVEANVSIRPHDSPPEVLGTRVEVKNMNSFRSVERAVAFEVERQAAALDAGEPLSQETRGWDDGRQATYVMRSKEESHDYRYFPEPDLPPLTTDAAWLESLRARLPELPAARRNRYVEALGLSAYDAAVITGDPAATAMFEAVLQRTPGNARAAATWVTGEYLGRLNKGGRDVQVDPGDLATLVDAVVTGELSRTNAREVFDEAIETGRPAAEIIQAGGLRQISDAAALDVAIDGVLAANAPAVADYRAGKAQAIGFLVGQVMKATRGQANAALVQAALRDRLAGAGEG